MTLTGFKYKGLCIINFSLDVGEWSNSHSGPEKKLITPTGWKDG